MNGLPRSRLGALLVVVLALLIFLLFALTSSSNRISNFHFNYARPRKSQTSAPDTVSKPKSETSESSRQAKSKPAFRISSSKLISILDNSMPINDNYRRAELKTSRGNVPIFVHDLNQDRWVSGAIVSSGAWEGGMVTAWQTLLSKLPNATVVDVGANLGQYGLAALVMKRPAVFVEPVRRNALRIVKSIQAGPKDFRKLAIVLQNALSDTRRRILFRTFPGNVGGTQILDEKDSKLSTKAFGSAYTIVLDDLVGIVPGRNILMKVDAECSEKQALKKGAKFFSHYRVHAIMMEWHKCTSDTDDTPQFVNEMAKWGFKPYQVAAVPNSPLDPSKARQSWPGDILWVNVQLGSLIPTKQTSKKAA